MPKILYFVAGAVTAVAAYALVQLQRPGYSDTPVIPGQKWKVHDPERPYPAAVTPGDVPWEAPSDAVVLFDGKNLDQWISNDPGDDLSKAVPAKWKLEDGTIQVVPGSGTLYTKEKFGDVQLHIEWQEDENVTGTSQNRGNSGVFFLGNFEMQVLDSYKSPTYADGQAGALYGQYPPRVNPIKKPGEWQVYDAVFEAPKFEGDKLVSPAYITLFFNGVMVHNRQVLHGPTTHRTVELYKPMSPEGRISLQDHGPKEKLRFRNIWVRRLKGYDQPEAAN